MKATKKEIIKVRVSKAEHELAKMKAKKMGTTVAEFLMEALLRSHITKRQYDAAMVKASKFTKSDLVRMIVFRAEIKSRLTPKQLEAIFELTATIKKTQPALSTMDGGDAIVDRMNRLLDDLYNILN